MDFSIELDALHINYVGDLSPEKVLSAARMALNKVADRTRTRADRAIRSEIAFPASYLGPAGKRLWVKQKATNAKLESIVTGRGEATSLARFARKGAEVTAGRGRPGNMRPKRPVAVQVKKGSGYKTLSRAFLIELANGNTGLAVRTSGGPPRGAYVPKALGKNLWLLYGPSVDQALISARRSGIFEDITPETIEAVETEFLRLIALEESKNA